MHHYVQNHNPDDGLNNEEDRVDVCVTDSDLVVRTS